MRRDCDTCRYFEVDFDYLPCSSCIGCDKWESQTNADHIRHMTDEELQRFLCSKMACNWCDWVSAGGCLMEEWLKRPYGGDT